MKHLKRGREFESLAEELLNRKKEFVLWALWIKMKIKQES